MTERLGGTGVWEAAMRFGDPAAAGDYAAEVEELGYSAVWIPDVDGDLFGALGSLLASTSSITVASGVLNLWAQDPRGCRNPDAVIRCGDLCAARCVRRSRRRTPRRLPRSSVPG